LIQQT
jgi:chromosome segregation ATPase